MLSRIDKLEIFTRNSMLSRPSTKRLDGRSYIKQYSSDRQRQGANDKLLSRQERRLDPPLLLAWLEGQPIMLDWLETMAVDEYFHPKK